MDRAEFRQRAMIAAMQALANPRFADFDIVKLSVQHADALLEAIEPEDGATKEK